MKQINLVAQAEVRIIGTEDAGNGMVKLIAVTNSKQTMIGPAILNYYEEIEVEENTSKEIVSEENKVEDKKSSTNDDKLKEQLDKLLNKSKGGYFKKIKNILIKTSKDKSPIFPLDNKPLGNIGAEDYSVEK